MKRARVDAAALPLEKRPTGAAEVLAEGRGHATLQNTCFANAGLCALSDLITSSFEHRRDLKGTSQMRSAFKVLCRVQNEAFSLELQRDMLDLLEVILKVKTGASASDYKRGSQYCLQHFVMALFDVFTGKAVSVADVHERTGLNRALFKHSKVKSIVPHTLLDGSECVGGEVESTSVYERFITFRADKASSLEAGASVFLSGIGKGAEKEHLFDCEACEEAGKTAYKAVARATFRSTLTLGPTALFYVQRYATNYYSGKKFNDSISFGAKLNVARLEALNCGGSGGGGGGGGGAGRFLQLKKSVVHEGSSMNSGPYFAYEKLKSGKWTMTSDEKVTLDVPEATVLGETKRVVFLRYDE